MAKARPALLTVALSAAAVLGYLSYRTLSAPSSTEPVVDIPASAIIGSDADEAPEDDRKLAETLPDFTLDSLPGGPQSIKSWPGKPLLINFWATWCGPCLREIPMLREFQSGHSDLQVVGIAVDKRDLVVGFNDRMPFNYPVLIGESDGWDAAAAFGVGVYALPFTVFTSADGSVLGVHTGELHAEHLENLTAILGDLGQAKIDLAEARARLAGRM
jgi:thiol-disulfide isomerase/thioredoxin